jgi:hypothetical protein
MGARLSHSSGRIYALVFAAAPLSQATLSAPTSQAEFTASGSVSLHIIEEQTQDLTVLCLKTQQKCICLNADPEMFGWGDYMMYVNYLLKWLVLVKPDVVSYTVVLDSHLKEVLKKTWLEAPKEKTKCEIKAKLNQLTLCAVHNDIEPIVICYSLDWWQMEYLDHA